MPIYRCNHCGLISEETAGTPGSTMPCARCGTTATVFGTVFYVEKVLERYFVAVRELKALQQAEADAPQEATEAEAARAEVSARQGVDLNNTQLLATAEQHAPLQQWFAAHQIEARFDYGAVDTSGFFDDAAQLIGDQHALFGELVERVRWAYRKSHSWVNLELGTLAQKDAQAINTLCRQLYSHTFFARYYYQKPEKIVRLTLQSATAVRQFFDGGWLEWYAFMAVLRQLQQTQRPFRRARRQGGFPQRRSARARCGLPARRAGADLHRMQIGRIPAGHRQVCAPAQAPKTRQEPLHPLRRRPDR